MTIDEILRATITMLNSMHILGAEAGTMEAAKKNLLTVAEAVEKARKEQGHDDHDEPGKEI